MWTFEEPGYLLLLGLVPVLIWLTHFWKGRGGRFKMSVAVWQGSQFAPSQPGLHFVKFLADFSLWTGLVLLILALAGPLQTRQEKVYLSNGTDIMIVLDESPSMAARDFAPENRFAAAKKVIERFVRGRENDPIGLVSFGKEAALRVPPTLDYDYFLETLNRLQIMELGDGTSLGLGISFAALHLQGSPGSEKVIIVLTDGENNGGEVQPETAVEVARSLGISLYIIGIGTSGTVPVEFTDPATGKRYSGTIEGGFNEDLLRKLTSGRAETYFSATSPGSLESIFQSIDSRENAAHRVQIRILNTPLYPWLVGAALGLWLLYLGIRKLGLKEVL